MPFEAWSYTDLLRTQSGHDSSVVWNSTKKPEESLNLPREQMLHHGNWQEEILPTPQPHGIII
jgi:hypothetical protein